MPIEAWPLTTCAMYKIYFFNNQGMYQVPIYRSEMETALVIVLTFKSVVPGIRVTQSDEVVLESQGSEVVWPEIDEATLGELARRFPPAVATPTVELLPEYFSAMEEAIGSDSASGELVASRLRDAELQLLAQAAREGLNLNLHGYRPAEVILTELSERDAGL